MKLITLALVATTSLGLFADGKSATATAPVAVQIVSPITLSANGIMQFGKVVVDDMTKPVVITLKAIDPDYFTANRTIENGSELSSSQAATAPVFHARYDQTVGWGGLTVTTDPVVNIAAGVKLEPDLSGGLALVKNCVYYPLQPGQEAHHFQLGGKLTADPGVLGSYTGQVSVTVAYN